MPFQIHAIPPTQFLKLFELSEKELKEQAARIEIVPDNLGYPCVVSLQDAEVGERVLLANYTHLPENTPFRASHAIYVRENAIQTKLEINEVPEMLSSRLLAVRGYDESHLMSAADVVEGMDLAQSINTMFEDDSVRYVHIHIAKPGCYAAKATRALGAAETRKSDG